MRGGVLIDIEKYPILKDNLSTLKETSKDKHDNDEIKYMTYSDRKVKFDDYTVRFVIWDTSGKHEYFDLTSSIVRSTDAIIFIYDITNRETFEQIKNYWYPKIKEITEKDASKKYLFLN